MAVTAGPVTGCSVEVALLLLDGRKTWLWMKALYWLSVTCKGLSPLVTVVPSMTFHLPQR
jgi:hypothetical protein